MPSLSILKKWKNPSCILAQILVSLHSPNLIDWSLAEDLSFHKIWFKSDNKFLKYTAPERHHLCQRNSATWLR